jgi:predicted dithiol-disulfide oxidoreductase (DUF899 family)
MVKAVDDKRRRLPLCGRLKKDYVFQWAIDSTLGQSVFFSELFEKRDTLLIDYWGTELPSNHVDTVWPYWYFLDFTPRGGRTCRRRRRTTVRVPGKALLGKRVVGSRLSGSGAVH